MEETSEHLNRVFAERVGARLRSLREARGESQQGVVDALREGRWRVLVTHGAPLNWPQTTLAKVERGERALALREALILAEYFGVDVAELVPGLQTSATAARTSELLRMQRHIDSRLEKLGEE